MAKKDFGRNITIAEQSKLIAERSQTIARLTKEDSAVMREIAAASKQDSSSMKALAVLTMVFLPFTFLAVCLFLSFPMFSFPIKVISAWRIMNPPQLTIPETYRETPRPPRYILWSCIRSYDFGLHGSIHVVLLVRAAKEAMEYNGMMRGRGLV
jgi:hypothetical protein